MTARVKLGVNIDHVATLRQARKCGYPSVADAARMAIEGGADGITIHLREDRRHIQDADLRELIPKYRVNLEMAAVAEMLGVATAPPSPAAVCLVPERREELTTEGGLEIAGQKERLKMYVATLKNCGIEVSLFIDPDEGQIEASAYTGAQCVEFHTGAYANAPSKAEIDRLERAARRAHELGLIVNAGHGLDLSNIGPIALLPHLNELNIGFSIIARALEVGLVAAVREMRSAING